MSKNNFPASPVTQKADTKIVDSIEVIDIIKLYQKQLQVDVSKYFKGLTKIDVAECLATGYRFYYCSIKPVEKINLRNHWWVYCCTVRET